MAVAAPRRRRRNAACATTPDDRAPTDADKGEIRVEVETSLNFDRLILFGSGDGIGGDPSRRLASTSQGTVADVGPRAMVGTVDSSRRARARDPDRAAARGSCSIR